MRCDHCGKEIDRDSEFCKHCGGAVTADLTVDHVPRYKKKLSLKAIFWRVLPFAFLCFILWPGLGIVPPLSNNNAEAVSAAVSSSSQTVVSTPPKKALAPSASTAPKNAETISYAEYTKIETDMTYEKVCEIIGSYGYEMARTEMAGYQTVIVGWEGEGSIGANANVTFQNGKVVAKAQSGLR